MLIGSATELERDLPFSVFVDALDRHVQERASELAARLAGSTRAELARLLPTVRLGRPQWNAAAARAVPGAPGGTGAPDCLPRRRGCCWCWTTCTGPIRAPDELLSALLRRLPAAPVLLALGLRPHQAPDRLSAALERAHRVGTLARVEPAALGPVEARQLLGEAVTEDAAAELHRLSGRNPFYLQQLARSPGAGGARPAGPALRDARVPRGSRRAGRGARRAWQRRPPAGRGAAVVGDPFDVELAAAAAALDPAAVPTALDELLRRDLVRSTDQPRAFRFRHPLVRTALPTEASRRMAARRARAGRRRAGRARGRAGCQAGHLEPRPGTATASRPACCGRPAPRRRTERRQAPRASPRRCGCCRRPGQRRSGSSCSAP